VATLVELSALLLGGSSLVKRGRDVDLHRLTTRVDDNVAEGWFVSSLEGFAFSFADVFTEACGAVAPSFKGALVEKTYLPPILGGVDKDFFSTSIAPSFDEVMGTTVFSLVFSPFAILSCEATSPKDKFLLILIGDLASLAEVLVQGAGLSSVMESAAVSSFVTPSFKAVSLNDTFLLIRRGDASFVEVWMPDAEFFSFFTSKEFSFFSAPSPFPVDKFLFTLGGDSTAMAAMPTVDAETSRAAKQPVLSPESTFPSDPSPLDALFLLPGKRGVLGVLTRIDPRLSAA
jgi:hypothetical protein